MTDCSVWPVRRASQWVEPLVDVHVPCNVEVNAVCVRDVVNRAKVGPWLHVKRLVRIHHNPRYRFSLRRLVGFLQIFSKPFQKLVGDRAVGCRIPDAVSRPHFFRRVHGWAVPSLCIDGYKVDEPCVPTVPQVVATVERSSWFSARVLCGVVEAGEPSRVMLPIDAAALVVTNCAHVRDLFKERKKKGGGRGAKMEKEENALRNDTGWF